ncbi:MAG: hypothetical protein MJ181_00165 [Treponema sp.]|nr:hypothetical protein [Treponema sp.]
MKRIISAFLTTVLAASALAAFEWGGLADNTTSYANNSALTQQNAVYLWGSIPLSEDGTSYIKAEGMYRFSYNSKAGAVTNLIDLDLLKYANSIKMGNNTLNISAGRFQVSDLSGAIFAQTSDGAYVNYVTPSYNLSAYAGFTGLLNSNAVTMIGDSGVDPEKVYSLADKYIPVSAAVSLPSLFLNQTLSLQAYGIFDCENSEKTNRMYATAALTGPLAAKVFYNALSTFGTNFDDFMNYTNISVSVFTGPAYITAGCEFASENYIGFTAHPACSTAMGDIETTGIIVPSISSNIAIKNDMMLAATMKGIFSSKSTESTKGLQAEVNYIYNILSDVQISAGIKGFKSFDVSDLDKVTATLKLALSF